MSYLIGALQRLGTQHLAFEAASFRDIREIITGAGADLDSGDIVYDLGAGYGHFVCYGACVSAARFEAIEIVARRCAAIERAAARIRLISLRVRRADAETVPFSRASVLFLNSPFFAEKAERFLARLAAQRPWRPPAHRRHEQHRAAIARKPPLRRNGNGGAYPGLPLRRVPLTLGDVSSPIASTYRPS